MNIAYFVDIHDRFGAVPRAMAQIGPVDLLIIGGDITTWERRMMRLLRSGAGGHWHATCSRSPGTWTRRRLMLAWPSSGSLSTAAA